jgi:predicted RNA-binding Zn-ribbon protein involved in translation (DUF1610 family)
MPENKQEQCIQCGGKIMNSAYALYKSPKNDEESEEQVFLCEVCRAKNKIKPLRNINELYKLQNLKEE